MKPRLRKHPRLPMWMCGLPPYDWALGYTPAQAYRLWAESQRAKARWVNGRFVG